VRVSDKPTFVGSSADKPFICLGETNTLNGVSLATEIEYFCASFLPDITLLPDGDGISYSSKIALDCFDPAATITTADDLKSICLDMEHSYLLDLVLTLTCPNGQSIDLFNSPGLVGLSCDLGEPVVNNASNTPGKPYNYCFTSTAPITKTWAGSYATSPTHTYVDNDGVNQANRNYLPGGNYLPQEGFNGLVGCPINGDWKIDILDQIGLDNGTLFSWALNFDPSLYTTDLNYTPAIINEEWVADPTIVSTSGNSIDVVPTTLGNTCYTFRVQDEFNCDHDTLVCFNVLPAEDASFSYAQAVYCSNEANPTPTITGVGGGTFASAAGLVMNSGTGSVDLLASTPGIYIVAYTTPAISCEANSEQSITISTPPTAAMSGDATICQGETTVIDIVLTGATPWDLVYNDGTDDAAVLGIAATPYQITTGAAGVYSLVSVTNSACAGTTSGGATIVVNELVAYSNTMSACDGADANYTVSFDLSVGDAGSYTVTGMNGGAITSPSAGLFVFTSNPIDAGTADYSFDFQNVNACSATATINGGGSICEGASTILTANPSVSGVAYTWTPGALPNTKNVTVSPASSQYYYVNYALNGCQTIDSSYVTVNPIPLVTVTDTSICDGGTANLFATVNLTGGTYSWSPGSFGNVASISPTSNIDYTVQ
jgi:subtilisin-like proprotein convertase family protein